MIPDFAFRAKAEAATRLAAPDPKTDRERYLFAVAELEDIVGRAMDEGRIHYATGCEQLSGLDEYDITWSDPADQAAKAAAAKEAT